MYYSYAKIEIDNIPGEAIMVASQSDWGFSMATKKEFASGLTVDWLRENMDYATDTGVFVWKVRGQGRTVGKTLGTKITNGANSYITIKVNGTLFYAHRLAWFYYYGDWPSRMIDHIDNDGTNNAIANLRIATASQNAARRRTQRSIAPSRGVFPHGPGFVARLYYGGKRHYLGYFSTAEEARNVYEAKAREIHGEFAYDEEDAAPRGDYLESPQCEMCDRVGEWGASDIRHDTTTMGKFRGALCLHCWSFVQLCDADKKSLNSMYRAAMRYIDNLDVFDENDPRYRGWRDTGAVSPSKADV